jgi:hypothetical protein
MNKYVYLVIVLLLPLQMIDSSSNVIPFEYRFIENQLAAGAANHVEFKQIADTPVTYRVSGMWNFKYPISKVTEVALNFERYPKTFRYVYRCDPVTEPRRKVSSLGTWFVDGRASMARVWAIGNIDSLCWTDSSHLRFIASQNEDRWLEAKWYHFEDGYLTYRTHGVRMAAFIVGVGNDSCRVGIVAQGWVKKAMPEWLIRLAVNIILPQLLQDLDKEIKRREDEKKAPEAPWYSTWYHSVKDFLLINVFDPQQDKK